MEKFLNDFAIELAVSVTAFIFGFFLKSLVVPFMQSLIYSGVQIQGTWSVEQTGNTLRGFALSEQRSTTVELKQAAFKLRGKATSYVLNGNVHTRKNEYRVSGFIRDGLVTINFINAEKNKIAQSTFLLKIINNGDHMEGSRSFYGTKKNVMNAVLCEWTKVS